MPKRAAEDLSGSESSSDSSEEDRRKHKKHKSSKDKKKKKKKHSKEEKVRTVKEQIGEEDYFKKSAEFQTWLQEDKDTYFDDLKGEEARRLFGKFVRRWNDGRLPKKYYRGISRELLAPTDRTRYKWGFAQTMGKTDQRQLQAAREQIDTLTNNSKRFEMGRPSVDEVDDTLAREAAKEALRVERKKFRKDQREDLDELLPRPSSTHERRMEQRAVRQQVRRQREASPDVTVDVYGGAGPDDIRRQAARQREWRENKQAKAVAAANSKLAEHRAREDEKMAAFREMAKAFQK